jgi:hypothetical protein
MRRALALGGVLAGLAAAPTSAEPVVSDALVAANSGSGEPEVEINPGNPADIVVGRNDAGVAVSRDGGHTFRQVSLPNPGDHVLAVEPDGSFVYSALDGAVRVSHDGGETWAIVGNWVGAISAQAHAISDTGLVPIAAREVGCSAPAPEGPGDPTEGPGPQIIGCDRPWLVADPHTGRLFVSFVAHDDAGGGSGPPAWELSSLACHTTILANPAFACGRQYVASSADGGRTWSKFVPTDSSDYPSGPTGGFSSGPVASGGVLVAAYLAASAPGRSCSPCVMLETSTDDGVTWNRHVTPLPARPPATAELDQTYLFSPYLAGDPSTPGRYAIMVPSADGAGLLVTVTGDAGHTFSPPMTLAESTTGIRVLPWIAYGPTGALGAIWRTVAPDGSYTVWTAVSPTGDGRFAPPVQLSSALSPAPASQLAGDDASDVEVGTRDLLAVWGDRRDGSLAIRIGRYAWSHDSAVTALLG